MFGKLAVAVGAVAFFGGVQAHAVPQSDNHDKGGVGQFFGDNHDPKGGDLFKDVFNDKHDDKDKGKDDKKGGHDDDKLVHPKGDDKHDDKGHKDNKGHDEHDNGWRSDEHSSKDRGCHEDRGCENVPTCAVPLPAAVTQGLIGMGVLGLVGVLAARRRLATRPL